MKKRTMTQKDKKKKKKWPALQQELTVYYSNLLATLPNNEQARQALIEHRGVESEGLGFDS